HVGEVILAMRIIGLEFLDVIEKIFHRKCIKTRVDFANFPLCRRARLLFHYRLDLVALGPSSNDASISRGILQMRAQKRHGRATSLMKEIGRASCRERV